MVSVDDYSVYVTEIKTALRKVEDFCLKAEVNANLEEFVDAFEFSNKIKVAITDLESYMRKQIYKKRK